MPCRADVKDGQLVLSTGRLTGTWDWQDGQLAIRNLADAVTGQTWHFAGDLPDAGFPGSGEASDGVLHVSPCPSSAWQPEHLRAVVTCRYGDLWLRRTFRLYPDCPAIAMDIALRGRADGPWRTLAEAASDQRNIERLSHWQGGIPGPHVVRLRVTRPHLHVEAVRFHDITDRRNNLVQSEGIVPYRAWSHLAGNLLLAEDALNGTRLFLLKEASCSDVQLAWPGGDFAVNRTDLVVVGIGLDPEDLDAEEWRDGYGVVIGVGGADELRDYQHRRRLAKPRRDHMILVNTWGDRGQDSRLGEAFARRELDACARLGASHFQLDDGWQQGQSSNSARPGGSLAGIWSQPGYWAPHPSRFPNGLGPLVDRARALGIELCVWFNPSHDESYAHWRDDAGVLIGLYRQHGIRTFKIDGVMLPDHRAHRHFKAFLDMVMAATGGEAVFNLDVTAGRRWGYHLGAEYGNLFLENRYTDWSNYYPHWTLRNLWQLARWVPPQSLQIEFLNVWRNADKYPADDPLRPQAVPFAYAFAIAMMAQPLGWFEAQNLPEEAFAAAPTIAAYRAHQEAIHAGRIMPIGEEPSGTGWTGFQSCQGNHGYLLIFRECNQRPDARVKLWEAPGPVLRLTHLAGSGCDTSAMVVDGAVTLALPAPFTFALYRYEL